VRGKPGAGVGRSSDVRWPGRLVVHAASRWVTDI
jgi:hypothetical protein